MVGHFRDLHYSKVLLVTRNLLHHVNENHPRIFVTYIQHKELIIGIFIFTAQCGALTQNYQETNFLFLL